MTLMSPPKRWALGKEKRCLAGEEFVGAKQMLLAVEAMIDIYLND